MLVRSIEKRRQSGGLGRYLIGLVLAGFVTMPPVAADTDRMATSWIGPQELSPSEVGIGRKIGDFQVLDLDGGMARLYEATGKGATVIVVRDPGCPVSRRYGPTIARFAETFASRGVAFVYLNLDVDDASAIMRKDARRYALAGTYIQDPEHRLAGALGVHSTTDVFVLDSGYRLIYRGAVDDQFGIGFTQQAPTRFYLRNALDDLLSGRQVGLPATTAPGCAVNAEPVDDDQLDDDPLRYGEVLS